MTHAVWSSTSARELFSLSGTRDVATGCRENRECGWAAGFDPQPVANAPTASTVRGRQEFEVRVVASTCT